MKRSAKSAAKLVVLGNNDPIFAEIEAIQERIRQRAFELSQTRPHDAHERYDWQKAESEILSVPAAELIEKNGRFELKFAAPGVNPDDLNVMVSPYRISLKSESTHSHNADTGTVHLCDFKSTTLFRSVDLPQSIDVRSVKVEFVDGVVHVIASKEGAVSEKPKAVRKAPAKKSRARIA
jgi:HSP20 family molecular chaperone IbpA